MRAIFTTPSKQRKRVPSDVLAGLFRESVDEAKPPRGAECKTCRLAGRGRVPATTMRKGAWRAWSYLCAGCAGKRDESLEEAMPDTARTTFDSAPYANMRLLDVARLLVGASQQSRLNVSLITKLVDRLVHALEFTIYSIQGRPEGRRIGSMIRKAFNALTARLPELATEDRRPVAGLTATLNEAIEALDLGPVEPPARLEEAQRLLFNKVGPGRYEATTSGTVGGREQTIRVAARKRPSGTWSTAAWVGQDPLWIDEPGRPALPRSRAVATKRDAINDALTLLWELAGWPLVHPQFEPGPPPKVGPRWFSRHQWGSGV